jgi:uncharacterized protein (DUF983 family)
MRVRAGQVVLRGLLHSCPNCGGATLLARWLRVHDRCRICGLRFEKEEGFFLGALVFNYTVTVLSMIIPLVVAVYLRLVGMWTALAVAAAWCVVFPFLFYPTSKSLWLMTYYLFVPGELPANRSDEASLPAPQKGDAG